MIVISIYEHDKTTFADGELAKLRDVISATVSRTVEGEYTASVTVPYTVRNKELVKNGRLICLPVHPTDITWQPFRICSYTEKFGDQDRMIEISLDHWSYDLNYYPTIPISEVTGAKNAINAIINAQPVKTHPFDIQTSLTDATTKFSYPDVSTVRSVLGNGENSFTSVFKCECYFDRTVVRMMSKIGADKNIVLSLMGNMVSSSESYEYDDFRTGIFPYWKDNERNTWISAASGIERIIPTGAPEGSHTKIGVVDLTDQFENRPTQQQLHDKAVEYLTKNDLANPKITISLDPYVPGSSIEAAGTNVLDVWRQASITIGDTFIYRNSVSHTDTRVRLVSYEYDCLNDIYTSMTVDSNYEKASNTISGLQGIVTGLSSDLRSNKNWTSFAVNSEKGTIGSNSLFQVNSSFGFGRAQCKYTLSNSISSNYGTVRLLTFDAAYAPDFPVPIDMWIATGINEMNMANGSGKSSISYNHITGLVHKISNGDAGAISLYNMSSSNIPSGSVVYFGGNWIYNSK